MNILQNIIVPTGNILIGEGKKGLLEFLSIGDYGKAQNIKADFLGHTDEINGVTHGEIMPLEKKWVVTVSTQYGCSMDCAFCDVPKVGRGKNATTRDIIDQVLCAVSLHPEVAYTDRLNIHYARMGEPSWNLCVLESAILIKRDLPSSFKIHPVVSTMMPKNNIGLEKFLRAWMSIKNDSYQGEAGLQLSINSTNEQERDIMFSSNAHTISDIGKIMERIEPPMGRKIALNFALAGYEINPSILLKHFNPEKFMCKITPMHITNSCKDNGLITDGGYSEYTPYKEHEGALKAAGYDVIVFVPSKEEDESRITCGNAILSNIEIDRV